MPIRIKSALFVDFDNIFIGLKTDDLRAAEEFGRGVNKWLQWISEEMAMPSGSQVRDILVRRCYGNPETFSEYRGYFTRNGFSVVDCPQLTSRGKNSADIVMVMDILDILAHPTQFDEFIIMSADADFTPLVLRLRMHDRRTVAIVAGNAAAAYRASCDLVVSDDEFVSDALRLPQAPAPRLAPRPGPPAPAVPPALLEAIARRVYEEASAGGAVEGSRLPEIFREFKEFTARTDWLGFLTLRALTEKLVSLRPDLRLTEGQVWSVMVDVPRPAAAAAGPAPVANGNGNGNGDLAELRAAMIQAVRQMVGKSDAPMVSAAVAQKVIAAVGQAVLDTRWAGAGTFRNFIESVDDLGLEVLWTPEEGYIYDPERHAPPQPRRADSRPANLEGLSEELASFIRRIADVSDTPRLSPHQYAVLFEVIAKEVQRTAYELTYTSRVVRDQMLERGETVSRQATAFVLRGIVFTGYRFRRTGVDEAPDLARAFRGNVLNLLRSAQVVLADGELALLDQWLLEPTSDGVMAEVDGPAAASEAEADAVRESSAAVFHDVATADALVSEDTEEEAASPAASSEHAPESSSDQPADESAAYEPEDTPSADEWSWQAERGGEFDLSSRSTTGDGVDAPAAAPSAWDASTGGAADESAEGGGGAQPGDDVLRNWFDTWAETRGDGPEPPTDLAAGGFESAGAVEAGGTVSESPDATAEAEWQPEPPRAPSWSEERGAPESQAAVADHAAGGEVDRTWTAEPYAAEPVLSSDDTAEHPGDADQPWTAEPYAEEPVLSSDDTAEHAGDAHLADHDGSPFETPAPWLTDDSASPAVDEAPPAFTGNGFAGDVDDDAPPRAPDSGWRWDTPPPADVEPAPVAPEADASATDGTGADAPPERAPGWIQWPPFRAGE
jgi:hypothetical protein